MEVLCLPERPRPQPFPGKPAGISAVQLSLYPKDKEATGSPSNAQAVLSSLKKVKIKKPWEETVSVTTGRLVVVARNVTDLHVLALVAMKEGSVRLELLHLLDSLVVGLQALWPQEMLCSFLDDGEQVVKTAVTAYLDSHLGNFGELLRVAQLFLRSVPFVDISTKDVALAAHFEEKFDILEAHSEIAKETLSEGDLALPVGIAAFALPGVCFHTSLPMMIMFPLFNALKLWNVWSMALSEDKCLSDVRHFFAEIPSCVEGDHKRRHLVVAIVAYAGVVTCRVLAPHLTSDASEPPETFGHADPFGVVEAKRVLLELRTEGAIDRIRFHLCSAGEISRLHYEDDGTLRLTFVRKPIDSLPINKGRPRSQSDVQASMSRQRRRSTIGIRTSLRPKARGRRRLSFAGNEDVDFLTNEPAVPVKVESLLKTPPVVHKVATHLETISPRPCFKDIIAMTPQEVKAPHSIDTVLESINTSVEAFEKFETDGLLPDQTDSTASVTDAKNLVTTIKTGTWSGPIVVDMDKLK